MDDDDDGKRWKMLHHDKLMSQITTTNSVTHHIHFHHTINECTNALSYIYTCIYKWIYVFYLFILLYFTFLVTKTTFHIHNKLWHIEHILTLNRMNLYEHAVSILLNFIIRKRNVALTIQTLNIFIHQIEA